MSTVLFRIAVGLVVLAVLQLAACGVLIGPPWRHKDRLMAWLVASLGAALLALMMILTAAMLHLHPSLWLGVLVLSGFNAAVGWVLGLLLRGRRRANEKAEAPDPLP